MRRRRGEKGVVLLILVMTAIVTSAILSAMAVQWDICADAGQKGLEEARLYHLARGGIRLAAARLEKNPDFRGAIEREESGMTLKIVVDEESVRAIASFREFQVELRSPAATGRSDGSGRSE